MKLRNIKICNFRSFGKEISINIENLTSLVGSNSSGKTSFLYALLRMFGDTTQDREIKKEDFHIPLDKNPALINENKFYIETIFEFDEIEKDEEVAKYVVPSFFESFTLDSKTGIPYIRIRLDATWRKSNQPEGIIEQEIYFIVSDKINFEVKDKRRISKENLSRIKVIYVPAVRNPLIQLKNVAGSILWRLLNGLNIDHAFRAVINNELDKVNDKIGEHKGISTIKSFVESEWKQYHKDFRYSNIDFKYNTTDIDEILKKIEPQFNPTETGLSYSVDEIGDGLRSLFYLSLVGTLLRAEQQTIEEIASEPDKKKDDRIFNIDPPCITIVAVEEPENHISPHLLGRVINNLREISNNINSQVILSSHSPSIIKRISATEIRHFRIAKSKGETVVKELLLPSKDEDAYKYVKEAVEAYPEIYFSSLVILGEGDSEEVVLPKIFEAEDIEINKYEIAIVPLGGRHVNHFWKLLHQLQIPYITLLDLDLEREGGGWGRIKYVLEQLLINGKKREDILRLENGHVLNDGELKKMHLWSDRHKDEKEDYEIMQTWIDGLEEENVFFSQPLDLDFMMLEAFQKIYIDMLGDNEGPEIKINDSNKKVQTLCVKEMSSSAYKDKLKEAIHATLKNESKEGKYYSLRQKRAMIWYKYFFLYRGKPVMHRMALSKMTKEIFIKNIPETFIKLTDAVKKELGLEE